MQIPTYLITILPLIGIIIGGVIQFFFSRISEVRKTQFTLRTQAYIDYLRCISESAHLSGLDINEKRQNLNARAADSKTRIAIYGSSDVLKALVIFEKQGARLNTQENARLFLEVVKHMRKDSSLKIKTNDLEHLQVFLFGSGITIGFKEI